MTINPEDVAHVAAANRRFHPPLLGAGASLTEDAAFHRQQQKALDAAEIVSGRDVPREIICAIVDTYLRTMNERWWKDPKECDFCGQVGSHSPRCSVVKDGVNPHYPYDSAR